MSVAVVTSTIGRSELIRAIRSVQEQTYPCVHYIFVDGKQFEEQARAILKDYPNVIVTYLPMNTGAGGWTNSSINAIAPFLVKEDIICYLDDDNWFEPDHIENCITTFENTNSDIVYALRNFYTPEGNFICKDFTESIGYYENRISYPHRINFLFNQKNYYIDRKLNRKFIDTNCYVFKRDIALLLSQYWFSGEHNDYNMYQKIIDLKLDYSCTNRFSVNYVLDAIKQLGEQVMLFGKLGMKEEDIKELIYFCTQEENNLNLSLYEKSEIQ